MKTTAPLGASEGPVLGAVGALAAGATVGLGKVGSTAADIGACEAEVPAFRLDCALLLPSSFSLGSPSRASGTMSAGSNLRSSFIFSGEICSCANAPAAESNSVKTMTRMVFCVLKCVKSFHLSHLQENRRDQPNQCDQQQGDRHAVADEPEFVFGSFSFLSSVGLIFIDGFRQIKRRDLAVVLFGDAKRLIHFSHFEFECGPRLLRLPPDRKSTRLNSSHEWISYAVFCLKKKKGKHCDSPSHNKKKWTIC